MTVPNSSDHVENIKAVVIKNKAYECPLVTGLLFIKIHSPPDEAKQEESKLLRSRKANICLASV